MIWKVIDMTMKVDLNADMGESFGPWVMGDDAALLDIIMPGMDGLSVLAALKADPDTASIPVIMLTTSSNRKDIEKAYENHSNSYVEKPLNMEEFLAAILKIEAFWLQLSTLAD
jgi:CheY-like chemotaxis protein